MRNGYAIRINQVSTYINDHLQQTLSLEALALVAGFSPYHFHRLFKKETGETLNEFVKRRLHCLFTLRLRWRPCGWIPNSK